MFISRLFNKSEKIERSEILWLIPIVFIAGFLTFYPHINYQYLLHVDEWFHISQAKQIFLNSNIDWYGGNTFSLGLEKGWHMSLAALYLFLSLI